MTPGNTFNKWLYTAIFSLVISLVLLNVFTPLRLNNDASRYLGILEYLKGGLGKYSDAAHDFLPHGYPYFLFLLEKIHLLSPFTITLTNIFSILISSILLAKIFTVKNRPLYFSLVLISFINIKQFTLPVSDQFFTLVFITAVYFWSKFFKDGLYYIIPVLITTALSIYIRTAGVALITSVIFYMVYLKKDTIFKRKILLVSILALIVISFVLFISGLSFFEKKVDYIRQLNLEEIKHQPFSIADRLIIHFKELGEIVVNLPATKLSVAINRPGFDVAAIVLVIAGIVSLIIYYKAVKILKIYQSFAFWAFVSYLAMIFLWPFYDTRFLIPLVPALAYFYFYYLFSFLKSKYVSIALAAIYIAFGTVSLAYSDALSLSRPFFLAHYGFDPSLTNIYRVHFKNNDRDSNKNLYNINKDYFPYLLEEYDRKFFYKLKEADGIKK